MLKLDLEDSGQGEPVVFVHGSWGDLHSWGALVAELPGYRLIRYSRRGHSGSECPPGQGLIEEDVGDLAAIVETVGAAHLVGNSLGAEIALRLAIARPELVRSLALHEPGFWSLAPDDPAVREIQHGLEPVIELIEAGAVEEGTRERGVGNSLGAEIALRLAIARPELVRSLALHEPGFWSLAPDDPAVREIQNGLEPATELLEAGAVEEGAREFAAWVFGPGAWEEAVPDELKQVMLANALTFLDEERAPDNGLVDATRLHEVIVPILLTTGEDSHPAFHVITQRLAAGLPHAEQTDDGRRRPRAAPLAPAGVRGAAAELLAG